VQELQPVPPEAVRRFVARDVAVREVAQDRAVRRLRHLARVGTPSESWQELRAVESQENFALEILPMHSLKRFFPFHYFKLFFVVNMVTRGRCYDNNFRTFSAFFQKPMLCQFF
jgi:hypothetical protein